MGCEQDLISEALIKRFKTTTKTTCCASSLMKFLASTAGFMFLSGKDGILPICMSEPLVSFPSLSLVVGAWKILEAWWIFAESVRTRNLVHRQGTKTQEQGPQIQGQIQAFWPLVMTKVSGPSAEVSQRSRNLYEHTPRGFFYDSAFTLSYLYHVANFL